MSSWSRAWGTSWGLSWGLTYEANQLLGMSEFEVDFADDEPKKKRVREAFVEPTLSKALRLRNEAKAEFDTPSQKKKAKQIAIRAAQTLKDPSEYAETGFLALFVEWLALSPVVTVENAPEGVTEAYAGYLAMVGQLIEKWNQDEEEAILALLL